MEFDTKAYRELLSIDENHTLELTDSRINEAGSEARQSHLLRETNPCAALVAHYRVWFCQSTKAPFREQRGWEKYDPDGTLLDREVRYSEQPEGTRLH